MPYHGDKLDHISPSQINAFIECPAAWALSYLYGYKTPANDKMRQGLRIENLVTERLTGVPAKELPENDLEESIADQCSELIKKICFNRIPQHQIRIKEKAIFDVPPLVGFIDYAIPGLNIDLKITRNEPKEAPRYSYIIQMLCYQMAFASPENLETEFALVYGLTRKTEPNAVIWTNSGYLVNYFKTDFTIKLIDQDSIKSAYADIIRTAKLIKFYTDFYEEHGVVNLPIDRSHFRITDYDNEIIDKFLDNELVEFDPQTSSPF